MANRDTIKVLQTRLATRLQAAQTQGAAVSWLAVKTAGHHFLLPLDQSGEIFPIAHLQTMPHVQPWFSGVLNIRGNLHGVVDLAGFLAQTVWQTPPVAATGAHVVTFNPALEINVALQVEALAGLRGGDAFVAVEPADASAPAYFGAVYRDAQGAAWQELHLRTLAQSSHFLNISA